MLTAHLPAGYVLAHAFDRNKRALWAATMIGSVLPDFDLLFFYFVDGRSVHHHRYWVHVPAFWAVCAIGVLPILWVIERLRVLLAPALVFLAAILLHLVLDTISGGILWAAPFSDQLFTLVTVPATQHHWILSFLLHWTFVLELLIWSAAFLLWKRGRT